MVEQIAGVTSSLLEFGAGAALAYAGITVSENRKQRERSNRSELPQRNTIWKSRRRR